MKTGEQLLADVSQMILGIAAAISLFQKHGFAVDPRIVSLLNDPQFVTVALGLVLVGGMWWRVSRIRTLASTVVDGLEAVVEARVQAAVERAARRASELPGPPG